MNVNLAPLSEIETSLNNFNFIETNNPQIPVMGRIVIGTRETKMIVLEVGLESTGNDREYEWYWEISLNDEDSTQFVSKVHNTGFTVFYSPSCQTCSILPSDFQGGSLKDFSGLIIDDITRNFKEE